MTKKIENKIMLITYSDSMGTNLRDLDRILTEHFEKAIGGVHILPFFPSSGDRGFASRSLCTSKGATPTIRNFMLSSLAMA